MDKMNTNGATTNPRDPHAAWWIEHQRLAAEHDHRYLIRAEEANEEDERRYRRLGELEELLRNTPVTTFEGYRVQLMALDLGIEDGLGHDDLKGVLGNLNSFVSDIERALERHHLKEQAQHWCWEVRVPSEPPGRITPASRLTRKRSGALPTQSVDEVQTAAASRRQNSAGEATEPRSAPNGSRIHS
jgi:hypothetical protein